MRKLTILVMMVLFGILYSQAYDFSVGGIYYRKVSSSSTYVYVTYKGTNWYDYTNVYTGAVTIPSTVTYSGKTYNVKYIDKYAFYSSTSMTSITIPTSVTEIGRQVMGRGLFSPFPYCSPGMTAVLSAHTVARLAASNRFPS